jgi:hypothetical protein
MDAEKVESPAPTPKPQRPFLWSASQRLVLVTGLFLLLGVLTIQRIRRPYYVSDPQPEKPAHFDELADRIDPNSADAATLSALPMIGPKRAADIVEYRESFVARNPGKLAFEKPEDLLHIKGIGGAMLASVRPFLLLPADNRPDPATRPIISP